MVLRLFALHFGDPFLAVVPGYDFVVVLFRLVEVSPPCVGASVFS